ALAVVFEKFGIKTDDRQWWCRQAVESGSIQHVPELLDLRKSAALWANSDGVSGSLYDSYCRALKGSPIADRLERAQAARNGRALVDALDDLTRGALVGEWPLLPLVIIDEIHNLKNP